MVTLTHEFDMNNDFQVDQQDVTKCLVCLKPIHYGSEDFPFANQSVLVFCVNFDLNKYRELKLNLCGMFKNNYRAWNRGLICRLGNKLLRYQCATYWSVLMFRNFLFENEDTII